MKELIATLITVLQQQAFVRASIALVKVDNLPALRLHIPLECNGSWNDAYRDRLNTLSGALHNAGFRWGSDYHNDYRLSVCDDNGQPWMCFNGGETIDLKPINEVELAIPGAPIKVTCMDDTVKALEKVLPDNAAMINNDTINWLEIADDGTHFLMGMHPTDKFEDCYEWVDFDLEYGEEICDIVNQWFVSPIYCLKPINDAAKK